MSADLHAAALAAIAARRALIEAGAAGPWRAAQGLIGNWWIEQAHRSDVADLCAETNPAADAALIVAMHADYARLLDALEAVLERHAPSHILGNEPVCGACKNFPAWTACPDARAALTALGVEG